MIVISETAPGGIGQIEAFVQAALDNTGAFERAVTHALHFCPRAHTAQQLMTVAADAGSSAGSLAPVFADVRNARGYQQTIEAQTSLTETLEGAGFGASRQDVVSVMGRLLWPGTSPSTDVWFDRINRQWAVREARLGAPIDPRVFGYLLVDAPSVRRRFSAIIEGLTGQAPSEAQLFARAQDFLMVGCEDSCPQCLPNSNRFARDIVPSRSLSVQWLEQHRFAPCEVTVEPGWADRLRSLLSNVDRVMIVGRTSDRPDIARALQVLLTEPFERDYLMVWPILSGVSRSEDVWRFEVELRSMGVQA